MNKQLIELQRGCKAVCVVILEQHSKELDQGIIMDANMADEYLFARTLGNPIFREKLDEKANKYDLTYFVIRGISEISVEQQNRYIGLVKDREFGGYNIPNNVILVFTLKTQEELQKLSKDLYHFCVVAF